MCEPSTTPANCIQYLANVEQRMVNGKGNGLRRETVGEVGTVELESELELDFPGRFGICSVCISVLDFPFFVFVFVQEMGERVW